MNANRRVLERALQLLLFVGMLIAMVVLRPAPVAHAASFTVDSTTDAVDAAPGNGVCATAGSVCTLRAAIQEANALVGDDIITVPVGTYTLTIVGTGENAAATGDLDITSNITINGAGAGSTIIQAGTLGVGGPPNGIDRVFHVTGAFTANISGVTVRNGNTGGHGGGIYNLGTLTVTNSAISGNSATLTSGGGGIYNNAGTLTITNSAFSGNSADIYGGGMYNEGGTAIITNSAFSGNSVIAQGGGIFTLYGALTITNSTFTLNTSVDGGGIFNFGGTATISNSTFSGNRATDGLAGGNGGGILGFGTGGTLIITNSTFSGNNADGYGGSLRISAGTATLSNTIVANSTSGGNCSGPIPWIINGGNNIDSGTTCGWGSTSGSMSNTNPLLGALANNGGATQTLALLVGSPAIDGVKFNAPNSAPATDQRGVARPQGARYDIGAYELAQMSIYLPLILKSP